MEEICRIFRVPPHIIGDLSRATFSNIEHQSIDFAMHTIRPWLVRIEQAMNRVLFPDSEKGRFYVQFNIDGLMRGDYKSRMEGYAIARQNGWMSANDIHALENLNPIVEEEGGDTYLAKTMNLFGCLHCHVTRPVFIRQLLTWLPRNPSCRQIHRWNTDSYAWRRIS